MQDEGAEREDVIRAGRLHTRSPGMAISACVPPGSSSVGPLRSLSAGAATLTKHQQAVIMASAARQQFGGAGLAELLACTRQAAHVRGMDPELLARFAGLPTPEQLASSLLNAHKQHKQRKQRHVDSGPPGSAAAADAAVPPEQQDLRQDAVFSIGAAQTLPAHAPEATSTAGHAGDLQPALLQVAGAPLPPGPAAAAAGPAGGSRHVLPPHAASAAMMRKLSQLRLAQPAPSSNPDSSARPANNPESQAENNQELLQPLIQLKAATVYCLQGDVRGSLVQELQQARAAAFAAGSGVAAAVPGIVHGAAVGGPRPNPGRYAGVLAELCEQQDKVVGRCTQAAGSLRARCLAVEDWHKEEAAAHQRRREEAAAARLAALKTSDLSAYLAMLQQSKNGRLQQVLAQTDDVFRQLAARLAVAMDTEPEEEEPTGGGGLLDSSGAWARLAAAIPAKDINQQPAMLEGGELREYQLQGLCWLAGLSQRGLNGILADDMGLGKTVQVIAWVCHCVEALQTTKPFLIVAPASVISNWAGELARWAPQLRVVLYQGPADARDAIYRKQVSSRAKQRFHVLLTTYELLMGAADRPRLSKVAWQALVVDEGHRLKNADCKLSQELRSFRSESRLLLTGTPLQNKLGELWSLLNFLMPDVFNSRDDFDAWFGAPLQAIRDAGTSAAASGAASATEASLLSQEEYLLLTSRLHQVLRPFMMRRLKESVATELPPKTEVVLRCQLSTYQAALYELVRTKLRDQAAAGTAGGGGGGSGAAAAAGSVKGINNAVMELRNICNHPLLSKLHPEYGEDLLREPPAAAAGSSGSGGGGAASGVPGAPLPPAVLRLCGKVDLLDQVLVRLAAGGHKVLLFCTMTRALDLLEDYAAWRGWSCLRLDGATGAAERAAAVARFNAPGSDVFIFMLSLRAGGVGLNLQAADTVIMYDSDWNPQIDLQAQARAHRIGQRRHVLVVRLLAAATVEEHILAVADQKRKFADSSITGGFFDGQTTHEERRQYLLSILDSSSPSSGAAAAAGSLTAAQLNSLIARGEPELQMLQQREQALAARACQQQDQVRQRQQDPSSGSESAAGSDPLAAGAGKGGKGPATADRAAGSPGGGRAELQQQQQQQQQPWDLPLSRVASEAEAADLIAAAREAAAPKPEEDLSFYGRGMRGAVAAAAAVNQAAGDKAGRRAAAGGVAAAAAAPRAAPAAPAAAKPKQAAAAHAKAGADNKRKRGVSAPASAAAGAAASAGVVAAAGGASAKLPDQRLQPQLSKGITPQAAAAAAPSAEAGAGAPVASKGAAGVASAAGGTAGDAAAAAAISEATGLSEGDTPSVAAADDLCQQEQQQQQPENDGRGQQVAGAAGQEDSSRRPTTQAEEARRRTVQPQQQQQQGRTSMHAAAAALDALADAGATEGRSTAAPDSSPAAAEASNSSRCPGTDAGAAAATAGGVPPAAEAAASPGSAGSSGSGARVLVVCGAVRGEYCPTRDQVRLLPQPTPAAAAAGQGGSSSSESWLSKTAFMKLAGEGFQRRDARRSIKLLNADGSHGLTLYTHISNIKKQQGQQAAAAEEQTMQQQEEQQQEAQGAQQAAVEDVGQEDSSRQPTMQAEEAERCTVQPQQQQQQQQHRKRRKQPVAAATLEMLADAAASGSDACGSQPTATAEARNSSRRSSDDVGAAAVAAGVPPVASPGSSGSGARVLVVCGAVRGEYCPTRDQVRLLPQPTPAAAAAAGQGGSSSSESWLSKTAFVKLAGEGFQRCDRASKCITLLNADGSRGLTLYTHIRNSKKQQQQQQEEGRQAAPAAEQASPQLPPQQRVVLADVTNRPAATQAAAAAPAKKRRRQDDADQQLALALAGPAKRVTRQQAAPQVVADSSAGGSGAGSGGSSGSRAAASPAGGCRPSASPGLDMLAEAAAAAEAEAAASPGAAPEVSPSPAAAGGSGGGSGGSGSGSSGGSGSGSSGGSGSGLVPVVCGSLQGWYCHTRGEVRLLPAQQQQQQQQQQQPGAAAAAAAAGESISEPLLAAAGDSNGCGGGGERWVSRPAFVKLAGPQRCHDAYKCIKVRGEDGSPGVTLATWLNRSKQQRQQRPSAAAAGGPADDPRQQTTGQQQECGGGEAAGGSKRHGGSGGGSSSGVTQQQGPQPDSRDKRVRFLLDSAADTSGHKAAASAAGGDGGGGDVPSAKRSRRTTGARQQQQGCTRDRDGDRNDVVAGLMAAHDLLFEAAWRLAGSGCDASAGKDGSAAAVMECSSSIISPGAAELLTQVEAFLWQQAEV